MGSSIKGAKRTTTERSGPADVGSFGVEKAAADAPSPVMREFAQVAAASRLTLGGLARLLNRRDGTALKAINVARHFEAAHPRAETVKSYAAVLGVTKSHVAFLRGDPIPWADVEEALRRATVELQHVSYQFRNDAAARAREAIFKTLNDDRAEASRLARAFALAQVREEFGILDDRAAAHPSFAAVVGPALTALADCLRARVDLFAELGNDARLAELRIALASLFVGEASTDIDHVMSFVLRLLRSRGIDTSAMEEALDRMNRRTWRLGDLARFDYSLDLKEKGK